MNPQLDKPANLNLPPPMPEAVVPSHEIAPLTGSGMYEQAPITESLSASYQPPALPVIQTQQASPTAVITSTNDVSGTTTPAKADDNDLIEKEWVAKAKEIIDKTREDPFDQNQQISIVKADYMKKRYNKDIKLAEQ
ncbi:MAG TPA: hypothetical protein VFN56_04470 [Candidatus Saccharimonadales bacterium]|nr:hypothetical protein [Candidatus Saccharimonadales bacterium]